MATGGLVVYDGSSSDDSSEAEDNLLHLKPLLDGKEHSVSKELCVKAAPVVASKVAPLSLSSIHCFYHTSNGKGTELI